MEKIGEGRYQEVFLEGDFVLKIPKGGISEREISRMEKYYDAINRSGIRVPKSYGKTFRGGKTVFKWDYCGVPLIDELSQGNRDLKLLRQVFDYGFLAYTHNVAFFPTLEQFTVLGRDVYFVDFLPSRTKEDFKFYGPGKREDLGIMFFGLGQKIIHPTREVLHHSPNLRGLRNFLMNFLDEKGLNEFKKGLVSAINQEIPKNNRQGYSFIDDEEHFQVSPFYDGEFDFVIQYPNRNIWTRDLFINDRRILEKLL